MGGSFDDTRKTDNQSQALNSTQNVAPWEPAQPLLSGLLGQISGQMGGVAPTANESGALGAMQDYLSGPGATRAQNLSDELAAGGVDRRGNFINNYTALNSQLTPTIRGDFLNPSTNPWFDQTTNNIGRDTEQRLRAMYAGSGRSAPGAGNYGYNAGRGIAEATAPIYAGVYNTERGRQEDAFKTLYGAGNTTDSLLSNADQQILANKGQATGAALDPYTQSLGLEAYKRNIPLSTLASLVGLTTPIASLGRTGTSTGTSTGSGTQVTDPSLLSDLTSISGLFRKG